MCPAGSFLDPAKGGSCELCPKDTYGSGTNQAQCQRCPSHTTTEEQTGSTSISACGKLDFFLWKFVSPVYIFGNFFGNAIKNLTPQTILSFGTQICFAKMRMGVCLFCHNGTILVCFAVCPRGFYHNGNLCRRCAANTYSTATNSARCTNCPAGRQTLQQTSQTSPDACGRPISKPPANAKTGPKMFSGKMPQRGRG